MKPNIEKSIKATRWGTLAATAALFLGSSIHAHAGEVYTGQPTSQYGITGADVTAPDDDWKFTLTPYGWASGLDGEVGVLGVKNAVDVDFSDILDDLDMALLLHFEAQKGKWSFMADGLYLNLTSTAPTPGPLTSSVDVETRQVMIEATVGYRVSENEDGHLDVFGGARYTGIDTTLNFHRNSSAIKRLGLQGRVPRDVSGNREWVDPIVGLRGRYALTDRLSVEGRGDVGGFGVGSDLSWQVYGGFAYAFTDSFLVELGYRHMDVDYTRDGFTYDVALSGPILGLSFRF